MATGLAFTATSGSSDQDFLALVCLSYLSDSSELGSRIFQAASEAAGSFFVPKGAELIYPCPETGLGGINLPNRRIRQGRLDAVAAWLISSGGRLSEELRRAVRQARVENADLLVIAEHLGDLGLIYAPQSAEIKKQEFGLFVCLDAESGFSGDCRAVAGD